ncbi:MAG: bifunctional phosphoribosylaminoimidazolecarboxamide formyltransferase/IMP cyclohydrolase [Candidatus Coatesbacteria bacterium]|nr:bifunctional phosphoribosylaminoimidazolecarboxamide formyltransferase/IMP cyclohydrolase [Candidatus Coatesbacteria bacterium]
MREVKTALISVYNKDGIVEFGRRLKSLGIKLISTGGTAAKLKEAGLEVTLVEDITGFGGLMDGRVKTLHPKIHAGILARRDVSEHVSQLASVDAEPIDMVVVDFYPFDKARNECLDLKETTELIDIGGPTMGRSAAKNFKDVLVVPGPAYYQRIADELEGHNGAITLSTRAEMAIELFKATSQFDAKIASYLSLLTCSPDESFPTSVSISLSKAMELRYGENPHQKAALYSAQGVEGALLGEKKLAGKALSYNNIVDLSAALNLVAEFDRPAAAIIKHRTPCGVAMSDRLDEAYRLALDADPVSAFGCIIACNRPIDMPTAEHIHSTTFVEALIAPSYEDGVIEFLQTKKSRRFLEFPEGFMQSSCNLVHTTVPGGLLIQTADAEVFDKNNLRVVTEIAPDKRLEEDLYFAWRVCKHVKSNAIVVAKNCVTAGIGAGQTSRIDAAKIATEKAGEKSHGAVLASDAFFPFADSIEEAHKAGIAAIIQPGGSKRDDEVIEACNRLKIPMVFTGMRHFLH